jgi:hypothetical protein
MFLSLYAERGYHARQHTTTQRPQIVPKVAPTTTPSQHGFFPICSLAANSTQVLLKSAVFDVFQQQNEFNPIKFLWTQTSRDSLCTQTTKHFFCTQNKEAFQLKMPSTEITRLVTFKPWLENIGLTCS